jgi:hypothetical protein
MTFRSAGRIADSYHLPRFLGRRGKAAAKLPPGQYLTTDFPVLSAGPTPTVPVDQWEFTIDDGTDVLRRWNWKSFRELPTETFTVDLHCVTRWSKLGTTWEGVSCTSMTGYAWPGNIGELQSLIERAVILSPGSILQVPLRYVRGQNPKPAQNAGRGRTGNYPGGVERARLGSVRAERRRKAARNQPLHAAVSHEEAGHRPPAQDVG